MSTQFTNRQWRLPNNENKDKQSNYSMDFDGSQYIDTNLNTGSYSSFSVSAWIKADTLSSGKVVAAQTRKGNWSNSSWLLYIEAPGGVPYMTFYMPPDVSTWAGKNTVLSTNQWYHIVATWDGATSKVYIDGVKETTEGTVSSMNATPINTLIGSSYDSAGTGTTGGWDGQIDALAIFDYALSQIQVTTLYGSSSTGIGNPMSLSPKPVAYYPLGDQDAFNGADYLVPNSSLKDYVFDFNSSNQTGITVSNFNYTIYTASVWFKPNTNISTSTTQQYLLYFGNSYNPQRYIRLGGGYDIISTLLYGSAISRYNTGSDIPANQWANVTISFANGLQYGIYLNGVDVTDTYAAAFDQNGSSGLIIGERAQIPAGFDGEISNVLIWDTQALSSTEIETLYNNGSPLQNLSDIPQNSNLKGWWKLDASDTYDSSTGNFTIEDHAGSNDGTSSGMTQANLVQSDLSFTSGYSPYALYFDAASSDYISAPVTTLNSATQCTISFWGKKDASNKELVVGGRISVSEGIWIQWYSDGNIYFSPRGTGATGFSVSYGQTYDNDWHHYVGVYDGSSAANCKLYLDGNLVATGTGTPPASLPATTGDNFQIGALSTNHYTDGQISNVAVWNTPLTQAQVSELYNEGVPSNLNNHSAYSNLVSWWQLGSNSSFNSSLNQWTCIDEKGTNTGESSQTFNEDAIVDGVGSYANGLSSGMGGDEVIGDAPYSTANALSVNMDVEDRVTDTPS